MRLIMRLLRFLCLALVMCVGLAAFAQKPTVIKSGNQATSVVNDTENDLTITLRFDGNRPAKSVRLPRGGSCNVEADCNQISYHSSESGGLLYSRSKRNEPANEPSTTPIAEKEEQEKVPDQAEPAVREPENSDNNQPEQKSNLNSKVIEIIPAEEDDFKQRGWQKKNTILNEFKVYLEGHSYYGSSHIEEERSRFFGRTC